MDYLEIYRISINNQTKEIWYSTVGSSHQLETKIRDLVLHWELFEIYKW